MPCLVKLLVDSRIGLDATAAAIRGVARELDPGIAIRISSLAANIDYWQGLSGMVAALASASGFLALVLAAVGVYGIVSYFVTSRFREIGIRQAVGATAHDVLRLVLRRTMGPVLAGAAVGLAGAVSASGILSAVLFGVSPADPLGLGGAAVFVILVALAAGVLAVRGGTRGDPIETLRYE